MTIKEPQKLPKLTDTERHRRFVEMAKEVGASNRKADFDKAFARIVKLEVEVKKTSPSSSEPSLSPLETKQT